MQLLLVAACIGAFALTCSARTSVGNRQESAPEIAQERRDANSRAAHEQLIEKAKTGRIDVYFIGDSITRRWGATDYPQFLAHWKESFHGWNAANFGWGGDTAENVLWRLQHGELDGVNPRVVVIQVGANNLARPPLNEERKSAFERSCSAIIETCRKKAPDAVIYQFGVFPRNDVDLSLAEVREINARLKKLAEEQKVHFVELTDKLIGDDSKLKKGVTVDGLHLSLKGYQIWADALTPILEKELGPKKNEDAAPPPTGDPKASRK
jgi:lysophospholipase L1-like esterase